ncbi:MAG: hypothetical protein ACJ76H_14420 [Bacteriovoracaceae bacterium]
MNLRDSFPSLSLFSDIDWNAVSKEFGPASKVITFPEYLELKVEEGDCPRHVLELAYFDSALMALQEGEFVFPDSPGFHLNPSACYLSFDFDILKMVTDAQDGTIAIIERPNVLCVYLDENGNISFHELSETELEVLQTLEENNHPEKTNALTSLTEVGLVLHIS